GAGRDPQRRARRPLRPPKAEARGGRAHARAEHAPERMRRPAELLLDREGFLAWMIGLMVFLAALAIAAGLAADGAAARWARSLAGTATVQVPADAADRLDALAAALRGVPGVRQARPIGLEETQALLEPWLGTELRDLPLPRLLDL